MRTLSLTLIAGLAVSLIAVPATASDVDTVSVKVATGRLDFAKPADVARLQSKLGRAADAACAMPGRRGVRDSQEFAACRTRALSEARLKADRAIAAARSPGAGADAAMQTIQ